MCNYFGDYVNPRIVNIERLLDRKPKNKHGSSRIKPTALNEVTGKCLLSRACARWAFYVT